MSYRVVCVSRTISAGGEPVGHRVAERLGFRYFDDEVIALASEKAGLDPAVVADAEHHKSLLSRLMDALSRGPAEPERLLPLRAGNPYYAPQPRPTSALPQGELRKLIREAIVQIADRGTAVIVAHAASLALANRKEVLRVLVTPHLHGRDASDCSATASS